MSQMGGRGVDLPLAASVMRVLEFIVVRVELIIAYQRSGAIIVGFKTRI
jgi:hypothetical protein